jgi:hypothetical protein
VLDWSEEEPPLLIKPYSLAELDATVRRLARGRDPRRAHPA